LKKQKIPVHQHPQQNSNGIDLFNKNFFEFYFPFVPNLKKKSNTKSQRVSINHRNKQKLYIEISSNINKFLKRPTLYKVNLQFESTCDSNPSMLLLSFLVVILFVLCYFVKRFYDQGNIPNLPPGSLGWPIGGDSIPF
jgi:hypothetical protein